MPPCPLFSEHHYLFRIFALDNTLAISPAQVTYGKLVREIKGNIAGSGYMCGTFE
ncbi:MAG: hypothetical protein JW863_21160 [Chitinispirillaceae bacterium]|nr:hypothetical protein [Chitinispirillaceae bacterium]